MEVMPTALPGQPNSVDARGGNNHCQTHSRGLASRMDMSRLVAPVRGQHRGAVCGSASCQSDTPDGFHRSKAGPRPGTKGAGQPAGPYLDVRSLFQS